MADGDLREAGFPRQRLGLRLVLGIAPGMHEDDGDRVDPLGLGRAESLARGRLVEGGLDRPVGKHPLGHFGDFRIKLLGQDDLFGKDIRPRLIGDAQGIAKTLGDEEKRLVALPLQKCVCRHRRAHPHRADASRRDRRAGFQPEGLANALQRRVVIDAGIFRQELAGRERAVRRLGDNVGEGAAAIDPEIEAVGRLRG